ncbi:MAG: hypothetical protein WCJ60_03570 [bacterium]
MQQDIRRSTDNVLDLRAHGKHKKSSKSKFVKKIILALVLIIIALSMYLIFVNKNKKISTDTNLDIKSQISKHFVLPVDEEPAIATVTDKNKISTPFFKQAENGDKIIIYQNAKRVILYRPSIDRIIDVGPVSIAEPNTN